MRDRDANEAPGSEGGRDEEARLVARLRRSEPGAFDEVYRRHHPGIWRFLRQLARSQALAEDLFQDTWVAAARNAHRLRSDTRLLAWLYAIARNKHKNALRTAARDRQRHTALAAEAAEPGLVPDAEAALRQRAERLRAALARLPDAHREVLLLFAVQGLETEAVGRILELSADAVRKRLSRARAALLCEAGLDGERDDLPRRDDP
ncbi:MAG: sigma-70 family RNA polymerase sigma factor [Polyangiaceae bacterium]|nr:sigma-70 family RNA polymerase sigma factor [Polyangiaceae bacterium]